MSLLKNGAGVGQDLKVLVTTHTHPGPCPFAIALIEDPNGATVEIRSQSPDQVCLKFMAFPEIQNAKDHSDLRVFSRRGNSPVVGLRYEP